MFVLPSTSGAARGYWSESYWQELERAFSADEHKNTAVKPGMEVITMKSGRVIEKGRLADSLIKRWFAMTGADTAKPKDLMPYLVKAGVFTKDHRDGFPLRNLLRQLDAVGQLTVMTTVRFEQKRKNKSWFFVNPG